MVTEQIEQRLDGFTLDVWIRGHVAVVLQGLPAEVQSDLMDDPSFLMCDYDPIPQVMMHVPMRLVGRGRPGRSIVLKKTLKRRPAPFVRWVVAHELAHAYLRHGGRWPEEDPEVAADSLAAVWGFPKPGPLA